MSRRKVIVVALLSLFMTADATQIIQSGRATRDPAPPPAGGGGDAPAWCENAADGAWGTIAGGAGQTISDNDQTPVPNVGYGPVTEIVTAWTGAAVDPIRKEYLVVANGGHANYPGNEAYALDLTQDNPGWRRIINRTPDANMGDHTLEGDGRFADGRSRAMHNGNQFWADGRVWFPMQNSVTSNQGGGRNNVTSFDRDSLGDALTPQAWANNAGPWEFHGGTDSNTFCYVFGYGVWDSVNRRGYGIANGLCTGIAWWSWSTDPNDPNFGESSGDFTSSTHIRPSWAAAAPDIGQIFVGDRENGGRVGVLNVSTNSWSFPSRSGTFHYTEGSGAVYLSESHQLVIGNPKDTDSDLFVVDIPMTGSAYNPSGTLVGSQINETGGPDYVEPIWAGTGVADFAFSKWNLVEDACGTQDVIIFLPSTENDTYFYKIPEGGF